MSEKKKPDDMLEAVAQALADGACCDLRDKDGRCCMTEQARKVFQAIEARGGPTLAQIERIADGQLMLTDGYED